jgi:hypothetical protein
VRQGKTNLTKEDIETVFCLYDRVNSLRMQHDVRPAQDSSDVIENEELSGFLKDLLELVKKVRARRDGDDSILHYGLFQY